MKNLFKATTLALTVLSSSTAFAGGHGTHWGYSGHEGPEYWGELSHQYATCKNGKSQSPINLSGFVDEALKPIGFSYRTSPMNIVNNGHTVQVNFQKGSSIQVDGKTFKLLQVHFHTPSENHINGHSYPMEAHFVHASDQGELAVVAVMIQEGAADPFIAKIVKAMPQHAGKAQDVAGVSVNGMEFLPAFKGYYRFEGSLTTPPCSEGVRWLVMKHAAHASAQQIAALHKVIGTNNRPIQAKNGRSVKQ
ncbi:carbonic anhydrase family protein [Thiomicrorhabdus sp.]|uniref:carbonic anhydrase n=1 Tax=Thiomicrorhabdus sp. TaxID=2039724 RepID=UPI0029C92DC6|nr:carbonic anhydrase family protein [Thiomicrorhabdus sp.]